MTEIYLVRHGESKGNKHYQETGQNIIGAGELGTDLTDKGKEQIKESLEKLKIVEFCAIYSSDMIRTHESALIMASHFSVPVTTTAKLREHNREDETLDEGAKRLSTFLVEIESKHTDRKVLIVTHSALMRMFLISLGFAKSEEEFPGGVIENGGFVKLSVDGDKFTVTETYKVTKL